MTDNPGAARQQELNRLYKEYYENERAFMDEARFSEELRLLRKGEELHEQIQALLAPSHSGDVPPAMPTGERTE